MYLNQSFELKAGSLAYTCVRIKDADLEKFEHDFVYASQQAPRLFRNAAFIVEFLFDEFVSSIKLKRIRKTIESVGASMAGIKSDLQEQIAEIQRSNIPIIHDNKSQVGTASSKTTRSYEKNDIMVQGRIRSGTQIYAKDKDLVVCGDVSHGSEIIASGNIFIYGALKGKAIAGADGNVMARIFSYEFSPELISIAGVYIVSEDISSEFHMQSVQALMVDERIQLQCFPGSQTRQKYT